ncbi:MAG TPA: PsiF family protein [Burkholderiales bacterium]|nr:PsiF family protein [Burkholderiales bacterium]
MLVASVAAARELTPAQQRMKACNTQAKEKQLAGAARNHFMTSCLNGDGSPRKLSARQRLHEECNARARGLEGAERRGFMTQCEKGEAGVEQTSEREQQENCARRADGRRLAGDDRRDYMKGCLDGAAEASR